MNNRELDKVKKSVVEMLFNLGSDLESCYKFENNKDLPTDLELMTEAKNLDRHSKRIMNYLHKKNDVLAKRAESKD